MDMTIMGNLAKAYNANHRNNDAVALYDQARSHYMSLPEQLNQDGDLNTPFDWLPPPVPCVDFFRNELNIFLGMLSNSGSPTDSIQIIHVTSRWLRGRSAETFWDNVNDSREWDENDLRRSEVPSYTAEKWDMSRYSLPIEIRVRLGINWIRAQNMDEAMV
jgi:hypothetical protein